MGFEPRIVRPDDVPEPDDATGPDSVPGNGVPSAERSARLPGEGRLASGQPNPPGANREPSGADTAPADEIELPADLEELAAQLSADAALLESRYPAASDRRSESNLAWRHLLRVTAAAMFLVGSIWWVSHWRARGERHDATPAVEPASNTIAGADADEPKHTFTIAGADERADRGASAPSAERAANATPPSSASALEPPACCAIPSRLQMLAAASDANRRPTPDSRPPAGGDASRAARVTELSFTPTTSAGERSGEAPRDRLGMLEAQLAAFEQVITKLQAEVRRRDQLLQESNELVRSLSAEVAALREQIAGRQIAAKAPGANPAPPGAAGVDSAR